MSRRIWFAASVLASAVVAVPVTVVFASVFLSSDGEWSHLASTWLPVYVRNTLILASAVSMATAAIGVSVAWLLTHYRFPGCGMLSWAQLLPLAVPAYLSAYALADLLQVSGPVQTWLRDATSWEVGGYWFPNIRSLGGAIVVLSFSLYPYVFFAARLAFMEQSQSALEASRNLGRGPWGTFLGVGIPLARPAIVGGLVLVIMETVADFGAVDYLAVDTFATGIYRTRFALESPVAAAQLSALLLSVLFLVLALEWTLRRRHRFHRTGTRCYGRHRRRLGGLRGALATIGCGAPILIGFGVPAVRLLQLAIREGDLRTSMLGRLVLDTAFVATVAALIAVALSVIVAYAARIGRGPLASGPAIAARAGYAIPGPVIAIGLLIPLGWLDHRGNDFASWLSDGAWRPGLVLTGSIVALLVGYQTRFLAVGLSLVQNSLTRTNPNIDDAGRTLGAGPTGNLLRLHLPMMRRSLIAAGLLVFVDVAKELPMTLMLRPFNFDTLAVRVYELSSDERLGEASTAALLIVVVGLVPVLLLARQIGSHAEDQARDPR